MACSAWALKKVKRSKWKNDFNSHLKDKSKIKTVGKFKIKGHFGGKENINCWKEN